MSENPLAVGGNSGGQFVRHRLQKVSTHWYSWQFSQKRLYSQIDHFSGGSYVAQSDVRRMRIPNAASRIGFALFVVTAPLIGVDEAMTRMIVAFVVFTIGFLLFMLRVLAREM